MYVTHIVYPDRSLRNIKVHDASQQRVQFRATGREWRQSSSSEVVLNGDQGKCSEIHWVYQVHVHLPELGTQEENVLRC